MRPDHATVHPVQRKFTLLGIITGGSRGRTRLILYNTALARPSAAFVACQHANHDIDMTLPVSTG